MARFGHLVRLLHLVVAYLGLLNALKYVHANYSYIFIIRIQY